MSRIAEDRPAAEPSSFAQKERRRRIVQVAGDLAAMRGVEKVQMHEVAGGAQVAIGTLYRYFPSKTHLFTAVVAGQVEQLTRNAAAAESTGSPERDICRLLTTASRELLRRPVLAAGLLQSTNSAHAAQIPDAARIDATFRGVLLDMLRCEHPTDADRTAVWLLMQCWFGLLTSCLNGRTTAAAVEHDLEAACRMLLAPEARASIRTTDRLRARVSLHRTDEKQVS